MILTTLLFGAAIIAGVGLVARFWNDITDWLKRAVNKVKSIVNGIVYGVTVFIRKTKEGIKEISKHYSKEQTQWTETVTTRTIPESEVPEEIRNKASLSKDTDITKELEMQLQN